MTATHCLPRLLAAATLVVTATLASAGGDIVGRASVIDGDTIEIHGQRIRLAGIDAPEHNQTCRSASGAAYLCGQASAAALDTFLKASRPTLCTVNGRDAYRRAVATCRRADGADIARWLVKNGWALDWPRYSGGAFSDEQAQARSRAAGMWNGTFVAPWVWRRR